MSLRIDLPSRAPGHGGQWEGVLSGLAAAPRSIPCKYLYDEKGSDLFEKICELEVYYPTRTETAILQLRQEALGEAMGGRTTLAELGSGASHKTRVLLGASAALRRYVPIDICAQALARARGSLEWDYPGLGIAPLCADYTRRADLSRIARHVGAGPVLAFFGSTIGNFHPWEAADLLSYLRQIAGADGALIIGVDLLKEPRIIEAAYNDPEGITAAFNLNVLARLNRALGADFALDAFRHRAIFDEEHGRIEMQLLSTKKQRVQIGGLSIEIERGEPITTEYSYKYSIDGFGALAARSGFAVERVFTDDRRYFSVQFLVPNGAHSSKEDGRLSS